MNLYVKPLLGPDAELDKSVRQRLVSELLKRGIAVTESEESADVILSGSGLMQTSFPPSFGHHPSVRVRATLRLANKRSVALWTSDVSSSRYAVSETASFVDKASKAVVYALAEESKRRGSEQVAQ